MSVSSPSLELLRSLKRSPVDLPPYDEKRVREGVARLNALWREIEAVREGVTTMEAERPEFAANLLLLFNSALREKRILLAYHRHRQQVLEHLYWELGGILPPLVRVNCSKHEIVFFERFSQAITQVNVHTDALNMQASLEDPPDSLFINVRVLQDYGQLATASGTLTLTANTQLSCKRADVEHLIKLGICEHIL
jgi:hypothetical protein